MRCFLIVVLSFLSFYSYSQKLNKLGKIVVDEIPQRPDHRIEKISGEYKVITDSFTFDGNTYFKIPAGYITSLEVVDNEKDYIKQYDSSGKLLATILSDRVINLKISKDGKQLAFYNSDNLIHINLNTYKVDTIVGSFAYEFVNGNNLIYYNAENKTIYFKGAGIHVESYPNQFIEYKNKIYIITKQYIYELVGNSLISKYTFKGKFFDSKIVEDVFYFVDKVEKRKTESYTLYRTSDFQRIVLFDKLSDLNK